MGTWGFKARESDTGLDVIDALQIYCEDRDQFVISEVIMHLQQEELLADEFAEIDILYDHTSLVLAELLSEFAETGRIVFNFMDEHSNAYEKHIRKVFYNKADLDFLSAQIADILNPAIEVHETYVFWQQSSRFNEWQTYVNDLLKNLKMLK